MVDAQPSSVATGSPPRGRAGAGESATTGATEPAIEQARAPRRGLVTSPNWVKNLPVAGHPKEGPPTASTDISNLRLEVGFGSLHSSSIR
jgi:hypothetical protein